MTNTQQFLSSMLKTTQCTQAQLRLGIDAAASHALKSSIAQQMGEYDQIESEIQSVAGRRGWELPDMEPLGLQLIGFRLRLRGTDSTIAERMIHHRTRDMVRLLKAAHNLELQDRQSLTLLQKLLDCQTVTIRQMQPFL